MTIQLMAKCSDCCSIILIRDGEKIAEHDGYVPNFLGGGDYIELDINAETGQILNWKPPTLEQIANFSG